MVFFTAAGSLERPPAAASSTSIPLCAYCIRSRLGIRVRTEAPQRLHVVARLEGLAPLGENLPQMGYPRAPFRSLGPVDVRCDVERPLVKLLIEVAPASAESRHVVEVHVADGV